MPPMCPLLLTLLNKNPDKIRPKNNLAVHSMKDVQDN